MIYFDNAATSKPKPECVYNAFNYYVKEVGVSPGRGSYSLGIQASRMLYQSRKTVAHFFGIEDVENVVFTKNSTEAINFFLKGYLKSGDHVLISPFEHNAILRPIHKLFEDGIIEYSIMAEEDLYCSTISLKKYIRPNTKLAAITLASNLTGQYVFTKEIARFLKEYNIKTFVDASQGAGKKLINMKRDDIDFLAFTGHKDLLALPGVGGFCSREKVVINPLIQGGTGIFGDSYINPEAYPDAYEAGTLNMPAIWSLKESLEYINNNLTEMTLTEEKLISELVNGLQLNERAIIYKAGKTRVPTVCFNIKGVPSNIIVQHLDQNGICVRGGLHCAILAHETIGTVKIGAVRVSLNAFNTVEEVHLFLETLDKIGE